MQWIPIKSKNLEESKIFSNQHEGGEGVSREGFG